MAAESTKDRRIAELKNKLGRAIKRNDILKSKLLNVTRHRDELQDYIKNSLKN